MIAAKPNNSIATAIRNRYKTDDIRLLTGSLSQLIQTSRTKKDKLNKDVDEISDVKAVNDNTVQTIANYQ